LDPTFSIRLLRWSAAQPLVAPVREDVFVHEQGVPVELEWDGLDAAALHAVAADSSGRPIGTARLVADGHIGRMAVLLAWRRRGVGSALLGRLVAAARERGLDTVHLDAQTHAVAFYARHGFEPQGGEFMDAGIPHVAMRRYFDPLRRASVAGDNEKS
jgi:predicted GNAT family N-acyltransferase